MWAFWLWAALAATLLPGGIWLVLHSEPEEYRPVIEGALRLARSGWRAGHRHVPSARSVALRGELDAWQRRLVAMARPGSPNGRHAVWTEPTLVIDAPAPEHQVPAPQATDPHAYLQREAVWADGDVTGAWSRKMLGLDDPHDDAESLN